MRGFRRIEPLLDREPGGIAAERQHDHVPQPIRRHPMKPSDDLAKLAEVDRTVSSSASTYSHRLTFAPSTTQASASGSATGNPADRSHLANST
jgi:hypothetical protein